MELPYNEIQCSLYKQCLPRYTFWCKKHFLLLSQKSKLLFSLLIFVLCELFIYSFTQKIYKEYTQYEYNFMCKIERWVIFLSFCHSVFSVYSVYFYVYFIYFSIFLQWLLISYITKNLIFRKDCKYQLKE